jgi:hypothetical protein
VLLNAAAYLLILSTWLPVLILGASGPAAIHFDRLAVLNSAWPLLGLAALFVRRPEAILWVSLTSTYVIIITWAPIWALWRVGALGSLASAVSAHLATGAGLTTALAVSGLTALLLPPTRHSLAGAPAA